MKFTKRYGLISVMLLTATGCATLPQGPSVTVMPTQGKPFTQFQAEDANCRKWAEQSVGISPEKAQSDSAVSGAAIGSLVGAGVGALIGSASGRAGAGAAIGAGSGLLMGTSVGSDTGRVYGREAQKRYDIAYSQCMASNGNQVVTQPVSRPAGHYYPRRNVIVVPAEPPAYYAPPPPVYYAPPPPAYYAPQQPTQYSPVYPQPGSDNAPPPPVYSTTPPPGNTPVPPANTYYPPPNSPAPNK